MATIQKKVNTNDLPNLIGQTVVVRNNKDNSEIRGTVINVSGGQALLRHGRSYQYVSTAYDATKYVFTDNIV
jgi:hypothetical protein